MIIGHIDSDSHKVQSLKEHLFNVAEYGKSQSKTINQGNVLFLLGLFHDLGKASRDFQYKLTQNPKKHVDHSSAGARYVFEVIKKSLQTIDVDKEERLLFQEIMAYVISTHHGMYDVILSGENDCEPKLKFNKLRQRILLGVTSEIYQEDIVPFAQSMELDLKKYGYQNLDDLIKKAFEDYQQAWSKLFCNDESEKKYYSACFVRLYLSLLKSADILDTINAYEMVIEPLKQNERQSLTKSYLEAIEKKYSSFGAPKTKLDEVRMHIAKRVKERGETDSTGIYRLDLPTGAGKTNLSMRYAFHQLVDQSKSRFFYITPFLSVLEQNATEIRKVIGSQGVLEHHSNVVNQKEDDGDDNKTTTMTDYLIDSWDSQVILTSMVQFFQTLFKTKSANLRRFSSLIDSVVILDEVQSLPIEVTTLFNLTMNFLNKVMQTSIVLCTATQPAYDSKVITHPISYGGQLDESSDIVVLSRDEKEVFLRTELRKFDETNQQSRLEDLLESVLNTDESILAIFNTKKTVDKFTDM